MTLISAILALVIEQFRPLPLQRWVTEPLTAWFDLLDRQFNDGQYRHGVVAWSFGVAAPAVLLAIVHLLLARHLPWLALSLAVLTLYLTMGFRQFSHPYGAVQHALRDGDIANARRLLGEWCGRPADRLSSNEVARLAMEQALLASHRHVFAPLICCAVLGPGGALLYRLALFAQDYWGRDTAADGRAAFGEFPRRARRLIDWLPIRLTAVGFAITGDFEDAVFCWRTQAGNWRDAEEGILLASGAGALGVRLGQPIQDAGFGLEDRPEMGMGEDADADFMQSTIGLAWRTLVLFLLLMVLVGIAGWVA